MESKTSLKIPKFFGKNRGATLSVLQFFTEYKATMLLMVLSKKTREFQNRFSEDIARVCHLPFYESVELKRTGMGIKDKAKVEEFQKGVRDMFVVKVMHVKDDLCIIAYIDGIFELVDMTKLE